ncbi:CpaF family protein [Pseudomonas chlororaphis]|uniref:CpaF family protein n=1 Tax=Pseudomonas chlororaphis TaxID=587753 RepID=UPI0006A58CA3|nr:CpaF family protein [Pseudomonas chlororaphis]AZD04021.1 Type II/IV secretion system ATP hydrolase TadA/VirB11/CpaF, TadA subfamily [Pseudomonas chlororaphis subsp. chlororaphis]MBM0281111.1 CpaF family protein [Pseudomonas chlororaphis]MDO1503145.1 CpaF family protein [Pseudomonas chlororaphis]ORM46608.1 pilus assembly protein CpaF [Pseudomonas chlororaphis subsp. chlororaphis]TWR97211.1 CpaF family protein [Pseudomonas chlororaphis subsp. chlororaphis]
MLSDFRNRLRQQPGKQAPAETQDASLDGKECASVLMAWEASVPDLLYETRTKLGSMEAEWREKIYQQLLKVMDLSLLDSLEPAEAGRQIRDICQRLLDEHSAPVNSSSRQLILKQISDEVLGLGPLEPLLNDASVSDILVNGHASVYVERFGKLQRTDVRFRDDQHLLNIIDRIVSSLGRRIDESSPLVDARLKDGSRVNAIIPPLAIDGPSMSIRRFAVDLLNTESLVQMGTLTPGIALMLKAIVRGRLNVLISGGTGSGKTTMLNVLSSFIPHNERIVTIEDSAELQLQQPHVVRLETRPSNIEGRGEVGQRELVRNSLRMRPDRIVIGEVRGAEALDMLTAMNTGHDGSLTTIHANTARDALGRIENMVSMTGATFPIKALRQQIASAIGVVIQLERQEDGTRRLVSVQEINGMEGEIITMTEIFSFVRSGLGEKGEVVGEFRPTGMVPAFRDVLAKRGIELPLSLFRPDWMEG